MTRIDGANLLGLGLALVVAAVAVMPQHRVPTVAAASAVEEHVEDARGQRFAVGPRTRIVSVSLQADAILAEVGDPAAVVAVSTYAVGRVARFWHGRPRLAGLDDLEAILALQPDLVLVSPSGADAARIARLEERGIPVMALDEMRGLASFRTDADRLSRLLGHGDSGRRLAERLEHRMARVAPPGPRLRALYLSIYGGALYGGTVGSSYHDVLTAAGCTDAAAGSFHGWPSYRAEQVMDLAPQVIVTRPGQVALLQARLPTLPCRWITVDGELLEDPGQGMLEAAEAIRAGLDSPLPTDPAEPSSAAHPGGVRSD